MEIPVTEALNLSDLNGVSYFDVRQEIKRLIYLQASKVYKPTDFYTDVVSIDDAASILARILKGPPNQNIGKKK